jgi:hypothetical protein
MALAGVFITWGYSGLSLFNQTGQATLLGPAVSSELMATSAASATSAPTNEGEALQPILSISASAPIYYVVGPNADATKPAQPRRYYDPASGPLDIVVNGGDHMSWVLA